MKYILVLSLLYYRRVSVGFFGKLKTGCFTGNYYRVFERSVDSVRNTIVVRPENNCKMIIKLKT